MAEQDITRLHAIVQGRVQGVGFRFFVVENAQRLDVTGWVRNRWDDTVEVVAEGPRPTLEKLVKALNRGPSGAFVTSVKTEWKPATGEFKRFGTLATY